MFGKLSLTSPEKSYQIARPRKIVSGTIADSIEQISDPNYVPTTTDYLNLVVRYAVGYIHHSPTKKITRKIANDTLAILCDPKQRTEQENSHIALCDYQLRMLFDIGSTLEIVRDIVERKLDIDKKYTAIDAGTGSGITLLAQYLQARRHSIQRENMINIGLEINPNVADYTDAFVRNIGIGAVLSVDSTREDVYKQIGNFDFLTNENIPYYEHPYSKLIDFSKHGNVYNTEPFFENLYAMKQAGIDLSQGEVFPKKIKHKIHKAQENSATGNVHAVCGVFEEKEPTFDPKYPKHLTDEQSVLWHQIMLAPSQIFINNTWNPLNKVGEDYYDTPFDFKNPNRVLCADNPLAGGRWNDSRVLGTTGYNLDDFV